jgi:hypothetical protein
VASTGCQNRVGGTVLCRPRPAARILSATCCALLSTWGMRNSTYRSRTSRCLPRSVPPPAPCVTSCRRIFRHAQRVSVANATGLLSVTSGGLLLICQMARRRHLADGEPLISLNRKRVGRNASPSASIMDSQNVKTTEAGGLRGTMPPRRSEAASATPWSTASRLQMKQITKIQRLRQCSKPRILKSSGLRKTSGSQHVCFSPRAAMAKGAYLKLLSPSRCAQSRGRRGAAHRNHSLPSIGVGGMRFNIEQQAALSITH